MNTQPMFIVNFCPTGMIPTKELTPHVPLSPREIVQEIVDCPVTISMVHIHARDCDGVPTYEKEVYARIISGIRDRDDDIVICVSTSGRNWAEFDKRSEVLELDGDDRPDMASLTLSSLNFNKQVSLNSPQMIQDLAQKMLDNGIKPELEVFDMGMVNYARYLIRKKPLVPPFYFNFILGNTACAQATPLALGAMLCQIPPYSLWSVGGVGDHQLRANVLGMASGGGVRVGLEDNIWASSKRDELATNHGLLCRVTAIAGAMGLSAVSGDELRKVL